MIINIEDIYIEKTQYVKNMEEYLESLKQKEKNKMTGKVKWFNNKKGYGFITNENGEDVFVHYSGINMEGWKSLADGVNVTYKLTEGSKGMVATNVVVIGE